MYDNKYIILINNYLASDSMEFSDELAEIVGSNQALANELKTFKTNSKTSDNLTEAIEEMADNLETHELVNAAKVEMSNPGINLQATLDTLFANAKSELAFEEAMAAGVRQFSETRKKEETETPIVQMPTQTPKVVYLRPQQVWALAASVLFCVFGLWWFNRTGDDFNPKTYLAEDIDITNQNIKGLTGGENFIKLDSLYRNEKFREVIAAVDTLQEGNNKSNRMKILQAKSYIALEQYANAIAILDPITLSEKTLPDDKENAQYFLAIAYISDKKSAQGKLVLKDMIDKNDPENIYLPRAKTLYNNIK